MRQTKLVVPVVVLLALSMVACTTAQIITTITMVTQILETELPIILSLLTSLTPEQQTAVKGYLMDYQACASATTAELATEDTPAVKTSKIAGSCGAATLPSLSGTPATVTSALLAMNAVLQAFLVEQQIPAGTMGTRIVNAHVGIPQHFSWSDRRKLAALQTRLTAAHELIVVGGK